MKVFKIVLASVVLIGLGLVGYKVYTTHSVNSHVVYVRALKNKWQFSPDVIKVPVNTTSYLHIYNEDNYDHGFFIQELGINTNLPARQEVTITIKSDKVGTYPFMCSVLCGGGHYRMAGQLTIF